MTTWPMVQVRYIPRFGLYAIYNSELYLEYRPGNKYCNLIGHIEASNQLKN